MTKALPKTLASIAKGPKGKPVPPVATKPPVAPKPKKGK